MKRRDFIKKSSLASSLLLVPNFVKAIDQISPTVLNNKKLVVIQLSGANDGLNTIIPYTNDLYYKNRPSIAIPKNEILKTEFDLGFNANLKDFKDLFDKGYVSIINNVGYENPNRSHFRATDIWHSASGSHEYLNSGWLGRYIDNLNTLPYSGIEVDETLSLILKGNNVNGIATNNPSLLYKTTETPFFKDILDNHEHVSNESNLDYLFKTMIEAKSSAKYIYQNSKTYNSSASYPKNPFAEQLKTTAKFINSHLDTKVYYTSMGGFDTHANQKVKQKGLHKVFSETIAAFVKDLEQHNTFKDTLILVFSEFGRRVKENGSKGTDHGTANNVYLIGKNLKQPGFYNEAPNLSNLDNNGDLKFNVDFRTIYANVLDNWLNTDSEKILNGNYKNIKVV